jgi:hypothetical protein
LTLKFGKKMVILFLIIIGWLAFGFGAFGLALGCLSDEFPYMNHLRAALLMAVLGPVGLFAVSIVEIGNWRWRLKPISRSERWLIYRKEYPTLSREQTEQTCQAIR